jgi:hypothetical protein
MSADFPPQYYFTNINFNSSFYETGEGLTQERANTLYLRKTVADTATAIETFNAGIKTGSIQKRSGVATLSIGVDTDSIEIVGSQLNIGDGTGSILIQGSLSIPSIVDNNYIMRVPSGIQSIPNNAETPILFTGLISVGNTIGLGYNIITGIFTNLNTLSSLTCQITYNVAFSSNATGVRYAKISSSAATPTNTALSTINALPSPFTSNIVGASILVIPPLGTFKVMGYQNSTAALNLDFSTTSIQVLIF